MSLISVAGPSYHLEAALSFYRALRVYPSPEELVMIYQKTVPPPVFQIVMEMMQVDVSNLSPAGPAAGQPQSTASIVPEEDEQENGHSPTSSGPPSETSSQEWDNVTDPGASTPSAP